MEMISQFLIRSTRYTVGCSLCIGLGMLRARWTCIGACRHACMARWESSKQILIGEMHALNSN